MRDSPRVTPRFEFRTLRQEIATIAHAASSRGRKCHVARWPDAGHNQVVALPHHLAVLEGEHDDARFVARPGLVRAGAGEEVAVVDADDPARVAVHAHVERDGVSSLLRRDVDPQMIQEELARCDDRVGDGREEGDAVPAESATCRRNRRRRAASGGARLRRDADDVVAKIEGAEVVHVDDVEPGVIAASCGLAATAVAARGGDCVG